jgi:tubulin---tyrosine ligase
LKDSFPETFNIEVDYAEFLDDALDEAYELRTEIEGGTKTWILKPSMSDRAQGIRIFNTIDGLQEIFDKYEEEEDENDEEDDDNNVSSGIITSQLRHFIVQEYISNPLLIPEYDNKKFHIRTYVLAVGALQVYIYRDMLALFAESPYVPPGNDDVVNLSGQLTNTCIQDDSTKKDSVVEFWQLKGLHQTSKQDIFQKISKITGDLFRAAVSVDRINFQPLPNAFEFYGLDFLVQSDRQVFVLEVNCYPDFKQTGEDLKQIVQGLFDCTVKLVVGPHFGKEKIQDERLEKVFDKELSGNW